jgi:hypothetical protein
MLMVVVAGRGQEKLVASSKQKVERPKKKASEGGTGPFTQAT